MFRSTKGQWTSKGNLRFAPSEAYRLISNQVSPIYANSCRDLQAQDVTPWLRQRFRDFFLQRWEAQGKPVFLHKYTGWSRISFFAEIFPEAKFIHIVRDGRAVANSWLQMPWWGGYQGPEKWLWGTLSEQERDEWNSHDKSFPVLAALSWKKLMAGFIQAEQDLDNSRYLTCKYEDFLDNPQQTLSHISAWGDLPPDNFVNSAFLSSRVHGGRRKAFQHDLSSSQLTGIETCLHDLLEKYDYK